MENLDPALLASLDPRALEGLLQSMAASMPKTEQLCKGFTPSEDLKKKEAAMHESKKAYDDQLSEVMKTLSLLQAVPDRQKASMAAAQAQSSERVQAAVNDQVRGIEASAAAAEASIPRTWSFTAAWTRSEDCAWAAAIDARWRSGTACNRDRVFITSLNWLS